MIIEEPKLPEGSVTEFLFYFNRKKQWIVVHICNVDPKTFKAAFGTRWGWFGKDYEKPRSGYFGLVRIVGCRVRPDNVQHELFHAWIEWLRARDVLITAKNEERLVEFYDELNASFWQEYKKIA